MRQGLALARPAHDRASAERERGAAESDRDVVTPFEVLEDGGRCRAPSWRAGDLRKHSPAVPGSGAVSAKDLASLLASEGSPGGPALTDRLAIVNRGAGRLASADAW